MFLGGMQAVNTVFGSPCSATDNLHSAGGVGSVNAGSFFFFSPIKLLKHRMTALCWLRIFISSLKSISASLSPLLLLPPPRTPLPFGTWENPISFLP